MPVPVPVPTGKPVPPEMGYGAVGPDAGTVTVTVTWEVVVVVRVGQLDPGRLGGMMEEGRVPVGPTGRVPLVMGYGAPTVTEAVG